VKHLVGAQFYCAIGAAGAPAALSMLQSAAKESFGLHSPGKAQLLHEGLNLS